MTTTFPVPAVTVSAPVSSTETLALASMVSAPETTLSVPLICMSPATLTFPLLTSKIPAAASSFSRMTTFPSISAIALLSSVSLAPALMVRVAPAGTTSFPLMVMSAPLIRVQEPLTVTICFAGNVVIPTSDSPPTETLDMSESSELFLTSPVPTFSMVMPERSAPVCCTMVPLLTILGAGVEEPAGTSAATTVPSTVRVALAATVSFPVTVTVFPDPVDVMVSPPTVVVPVLDDVIVVSPILTSPVAVIVTGLVASMVPEISMDPAVSVIPPFPAFSLTLADEVLSPSVKEMVPSYVPPLAMASELDLVESVTSALSVEFAATEMAASASEMGLTNSPPVIDKVTFSPPVVFLISPLIFPDSMLSARVCVLSFEDNSMFPLIIELPFTVTFAPA